MNPYKSATYSASCPMCSSEHDYTSRRTMEDDWQAWTRTAHRELTVLRNHFERELPTTERATAMAALVRLSQSLGITSIDISR